MNLDELLDVTEPVTVQFMEHEITAHVFTAGWNRLTKEERDLWDSVTRKDGEAQDSIATARALLPMVLKGWDLDGSPLTYRGKPFPENVPLCPDALLIAVTNPVVDKWMANNPTNGEPSQDGSPQAETPEQNQAAIAIA